MSKSCSPSAVWRRAIQRFGAGFSTTVRNWGNGSQSSEARSSRVLRCRTMCICAPRLHSSCSGKSELQSVFFSTLDYSEFVNLVHTGTRLRCLNGARKGARWRDSSLGFFQLWPVSVFRRSWRNNRSISRSEAPPTRWIAPRRRQSTLGDSGAWTVARAGAPTV